jgi:hypothetical protein
VTRLQALGRFAWDFVVGDDWRIAAGVVLALALTAVVAGTSVSAWWILPVAVAGLLGLSVWRAAAVRDSPPAPPSGQIGAVTVGSSDRE